MKTLFLISLAGAVALAAAGPLHAQTQSERGQQTREEPRRGNSLARFAARALGASEEEAEAAALLLPAVQAAREAVRPSGPQQQAGIEPDEIDYAGDAACAAAAYIKFDGVDGEVASNAAAAAGQPCEPSAAALLLPAVQRLGATEDQQAGTCPSGEGHCDWIPIEPVPAQNASGNQDESLAGEAEITLKRGAPQR